MSCCVPGTTASKGYPTKRPSNQLQHIPMISLCLCPDLGCVIDMEVIRSAGIRIGSDPLGGHQYSTGDQSRMPTASISRSSIPLWIDVQLHDARS